MPKQDGDHLDDLRTNRDLYLAIDRLSKSHAQCDRSLEQYLLALNLSAGQFSEREALTLAEVYHLVSSAFTSAVPSFDDTWRDEYDDLSHDQNDYAGFRATLVRQIVDLREMDETGILNDEQRFYGISAPRNSYWYNFDPLGYLECAMAGSFGGWEPGDDTGRQFVPGPVAVMAEDGSFRFVDPEDLQQPPVEMPWITWGQFKDFLVCGQVYE